MFTFYIFYINNYSFKNASITLVGFFSKQTLLAERWQFTMMFTRNAVIGSTQLEGVYLSAGFSISQTDLNRLFRKEIAIFMIFLNGITPDPDISR